MQNCKPAHLEFEIPEQLMRGFTAYQKPDGKESRIRPLFREPVRSWVSPGLAQSLKSYPDLSNRRFTLKKLLRRTTDTPQVLSSQQ